jgi:2-phospho-L-lactate guanylyltransferase
VVPDPRLAVVVPIRSFSGGKARLSSRLDDASRTRFVRALAQRVIDAVRVYPTIVVSSAPEVAAWAEAQEVPWVPDPGGLDAAARAGRARASETGAARVAVVHADLPLIESLDAVGATTGVTVVPDRFDDGTPVLVVPAHEAFDFSFGPGSFRRHCAEAKRRGLDLRVVRDDALGFDVDRPEDLDELDRSRLSDLGVREPYRATSP